MANTFVPVISSKPAAATETIMYTVPNVGGTTAMVLSLIAANISGAAGADSLITIRRLLAGEAVAVPDREVLAEGIVAKQDSFFFSEKLLLAQDERISVESSDGNVIFTASMIEFS